MGRTSGTPNKITAEVRDKLQNLIDELVNSLDIQELDNNQKIKKALANLAKKIVGLIKNQYNVFIDI